MCSFKCECERTRVCARLASLLPHCFGTQMFKLLNGSFLAPYSSSLKPQKMFIKIALKDFGTFWMCLSSILPLIVSFNLSIRAPIHILPISRSTACYLTFSCSNFFLFDSIRNTIDAFNSWIDVKLLNVCVALEIWDARGKNCIWFFVNSCYLPSAHTRTLPTLHINDVFADALRCIACPATRDEQTKQTQWR